MQNQSVKPRQNYEADSEGKGPARTSGYQITDQQLTSREQVDAFKAQHNVKTTPQIFIEGERIGGFDDLGAYFGQQVKSTDSVTCQPVIALFGVFALLAVAITWLVLDTLFAGQPLAGLLLSP